MYLMGVDAVMSLYEALMSGGRGGAIAEIIVDYENKEELRNWFLESTPSALGPMLMSLISTPSGFESTSSNEHNAGSGQKRTYKAQESYLLQQKAVERILTWIYKNAISKNTFPEAQAQFEEACARMNKFGTPANNRGQAYCESRKT
jgi:hypothetical protein